MNDATTECPSCGSTSLSPTLDGGSLICDECNELFQGFRLEEMDDEDAAHIATFGRESQQSKQQSKRLNAAAANARTAVQASAKTSVLDFRFELFKGVAIISRAIVDALVDQNLAPVALVDATFAIYSHWVRMCHAGGRLPAVAGASQHDFSAHMILAIVSLAALFVRSSLLPRDLCALAASGEIPFMNAAADLLSPEVLENERLRCAFAPRLVHSAQDVSFLAAAFATSEYTWPPLQELFDGLPKLYRRKTFLAFPVGQEQVTTARLVKLFGLPEEFCDRVQRFRELRKVAAAVSRKTHDSIGEVRRERRRQLAAESNKGKTVTVKKTHEPPTGKQNSTPGTEAMAPNTGSGVLDEHCSAVPENIQFLGGRAGKGDPDEVAIDADGERKLSDNDKLAALASHPGNKSAQRLARPQIGTFPERVGSELLSASQDETSSESGGESGDPEPSLLFPVGDSSDVPSRSSVPRSDFLNEYVLQPGLSQLPFTREGAHAQTLEEFPTTRSVLVDVFCTMRICFGEPDRVAGEGGEGEEGNSGRSCEQEVLQCRKEWTECLKAAENWVSTGGPDADCVLWSGLSPAAVSTARGKTLSSYAASALVGTQGDVPLFMNDSLNLFTGIAQGTAAAGGNRVEQNSSARRRDRIGDIRIGSQSDDEGIEHTETAGTVEDDKLERIGNWLFDGSAPGESYVRRFLENVRDVDSIDQVGRTPRDALMRIRGHVSLDLHLRGQSRGMYWWSLGDSGTSFWKEHASLGWFLSIARCFFDGSAAHVRGSTLEDITYEKQLAQCCDLALETVLNYVDIYLGEEGSMEPHTDRSPTVDGGERDDCEDLDAIVRTSHDRNINPSQSK